MLVRLLGMRLETAHFPAKGNDSIDIADDEERRH
jgi:hypothetical protein